MANPQLLRENLKKEFRSILISAKQGRPLNLFCKDYELMMGRPVPIKELGYPTVVEFLKSIPDAVTIRNFGGEYTLYPVGTSETQHIERLVAGQKSSKVPILGNKHMGGPRGRNGMRGGVRSGGGRFTRTPSLDFDKRAKLSELLYKHYSDGINVNTVDHAFSKHYGMPTGFRECGFSSMENCLRSMSDLIRLESTSKGLFAFSTKPRDIENTVFKASDLSTVAPHQMMSNQKLPNRSMPMQPLLPTSPSHLAIATPPSRGFKPISQNQPQLISYQDPSKPFLPTLSPQNFPTQIQNANPVSMSDRFQTSVKTTQDQRDSDIYKSNSSMKNNSQEVPTNASSQSPVFVTKDRGGTVSDNFKLLMRDYPNGIFPAVFLQKYNARFERPLNPQQYGYRDILELARGWNRIFEVKHVQGRELLFPINNTNSENNVNVINDVPVSSSGAPFQSLPRNDNLDEYPVRERIPTIQSNKTTERSTAGLNPQIKNNFVTIMSQFQNGIAATDFLKKYQELFGISLHLNELGFFDITDMIGHLPDIFCCERAGNKYTILPAKYMQSEITASSTEKYLEARPAQVQPTDIDPSEIDKQVIDILEALGDEGLTIDEIGSVYSANFKSILPWHKLGCTSIQEYMLQLTKKFTSIEIVCNDASNNATVRLKKTDIVKDWVNSLQRHQYNASPEVVPRFVTNFNELPEAEIPVSENAEDFVAVILSYCGKFDKIYIQLEENSTIVGDMTLHYSMNMDKYSVQRRDLKQNCLYVVMHPESNLFHRVILMSIINNDNVLVYCIDLGSTLTIPASNLYYLIERPEFTNISPQAVRVRLHEVPESVIDEAALELLKNYEMNSLDAIIYLESENDPPVSVTLYDPDNTDLQSLNDKILGQRPLQEDCITKMEKPASEDSNKDNGMSIFGVQLGNIQVQVILMDNELYISRNDVERFLKTVELSVEAQNKFESVSRVMLMKKNNEELFTEFGYDGNFLTLYMVTGLKGYLKEVGCLTQRLKKDFKNIEVAANGEVNEGGFMNKDEELQNYKEHMDFINRLNIRKVEILTSLVENKNEKAKRELVMVIEHIELLQDRVEEMEQRFICEF